MLGQVACPQSNAGSLQTQRCTLHCLEPQPAQARRLARCQKRQRHAPCTASSNTSVQAAAATAERPSKQQVNLQWDQLGFGLNHVAPVMYHAEWAHGMGWKGELRPYEPLQLLPSAQCLNYGQAVFEGLKAQRTAKGRIALFRPDQNAARMAAGADRLCMAGPPAELFLEAVESVVRENSQWVPPQGKGSLYLRPLLLGSGPILGLGPAPAYTLVVFAAAVGAYFKGGQLTPIDLIVEERFHRAAPGGMGGTKAAGNYSPVLKTQLAAKQDGFADVVYLDAKHDKYLEEVSSCNLFIVKGKTISTPGIEGTILPGVTRKSVLQLAEMRGYTVEERPIEVEEAMEADEIFTSGTAVVVCSVGSLQYRGNRRKFGPTEGNEPGPVALEIYNALTRLQLEEEADPFGWVHPVC